MQVFTRARKNRAGTIMTFTVGAILGGLIFSKNFTMRKGEWSFSTTDNEHSFRRLEENYKTRVNHLKTKSVDDLKQFKSSRTTRK